MNGLSTFKDTNNRNAEAIAKEFLDSPKEKQSELAETIVNFPAYDMAKTTIAILDNVKQCNGMIDRNYERFNQLCSENCRILHSALAGCDISVEERREIYRMLMEILAMQKDANEKMITYGRETRDKAIRAGTIVATCAVVATVAGSVLKALIKKR